MLLYVFTFMNENNLHLQEEKKIKITSIQNLITYDNIHEIYTLISKQCPLNI